MNEFLSYEGDIVGKPRMARGDTWKKRPATSRYWAFKAAIQRVAEQQNFRLADQHVIMVAYPMPKSWSAKKKSEMDGKPHRQRPDIDNILKGIYDALLQEDSVIWAVNIVKYWGYSGKIYIRNLHIKK